MSIRNKQYVNKKERLIKWKKLIKILFGTLKNILIALVLLNTAFASACTLASPFDQLVAAARQPTEEPVRTLQPTFTPTPIFTPTPTKTPTPVTTPTLEPITSPTYTPPPTQTPTPPVTPTPHSEVYQVLLPMGTVFGVTVVIILACVLIMILLLRKRL